MTDYIEARHTYNQVINPSKEANMPEYYSLGSLDPVWRLPEATIRRSSSEVIPTRSCLQEGVLSPLLSCLVVDGLAVNIREFGYYTQAYADDIDILVDDQGSGLMRVRYKEPSTGWMNDAIQ
ncbi:hypothetical protein JTB14_013850 [Gonioctena quinquepunctata]|nr:hypothetical protein JTB14_013850 [Gonioctena quinquepunctata]